MLIACQCKVMLLLIGGILIFNNAKVVLVVEVILIYPDSLQDELNLLMKYLSLPLLLTQNLEHLCL